MSKPSDPKVPWVQTIRRESGLIEHICEHGVGHPALGSVQFMELNGAEMMGVHGCDGCCQTPEWKLADATEGYKKANELLFNLIKEKKAFKEELKGLKSEMTYLKKVNQEMSDNMAQILTKKTKKKKG